MKSNKMCRNRISASAFGVIRVALMGIALSVIFCCCRTGNNADKSSGGNELDGMKVPDGFTIESVVDSTMITYPMFASFDGNGRLFVFESDGSSPSTEDMLKKPPYHIRLLEDGDGDGVFDKSKIFADSLSFPKGGVFYKGSLYVTASPDLLKLTDTDGDGVADKREVVLTGWVLNHNGALLGGPFFGPDGWLYLTDARRGFDITTKEGVNLKGTSARIWRCHPDGTGLESMAGGGYDNAIELAFMPSGETIGTMTYFIDPQGGMRDAIMHWVEGGVYPKPYSVIQKDHFKLTGDLMPVMTKMARVAPSGLLRYRGTAIGKQYNGNLFSAEFNTGRIMRHEITPDGGTFKTKDEPFITSSTSDIHLTDVLEDADGSLLVLNTGGWFIAGCPLSRVAKLDVHGGIYRIRKKDAEKVNDPWGHQINFSSLSVDELAGYIKDQRIAVRDHAIEQLIEKGDAAVPQIKSAMLASDSEDIRAAGVFALYRINTVNALKEARAALKDNSEIVRTAAARVVGLARDKESVELLMDMVQKDKPAVRRQAATALGQIGDTRAVQALLNGSADSADRFVEHSVIYALINLKSPALVAGALTNASPDIRKVAVVALDQMDGTPLQKQQLVPFLASDNPELRNTGIWVASHHAEWADIVISFLKSRLQVIDLSPEDAANMRDLMITFSENKQLQDFVAVQLADANAPVSRKALLMDVINHSAVKEMPAVWVQQSGRLLQSNDPAIRSLVLGLIEARGIKSLTPQLNDIVHNQQTPADFRLKALNSRLLADPKLSDDEFRMLLQYLDKNNELPVRQLAARVLAPAKLSDAQLVTLSNEEVAKTDVFLLSSLITPFEGNTDPVVGTALVSALKSSSDRLENISEPDLEKLFKGYPETVKTSAAPLMASLRKKNESRLSELQAVDAQLKKGDVGQGRQLFFGKAMCSTCHAVQGQGGDFAPDLTNIGEIRSRHDILEAILYPSASFAREHETSKIVTASTTYTGIIKEQLPEAIIITTGPGQRVRVQRSEIKTIEPQNFSMMPPGLNKQLTNEELSDLMVYLTSLPDGMGGHGNEHH
jgi:putative membrane-bound dehydrogenase-like protein